MQNLIVQVFDRISAFLNHLQVKQLFAAILVGALLLTTNIGPERDNPALSAKVRERVHQTDTANRPKTTGEWNNEVYGDKPLSERVNNTVRDSSEAFKQFGSGYVEGAKETGQKIRDGAARIGENFAD
ncbi:hypothetical protein [Pantanalinema sp. GBBB05]|uniref:hypothetical protein n=1 Tax=Pantanalinema sp. GBBB05 TaxID=2604139 RepID=UPI001DCAF0D1|nr:hypothetical protein [Pantanalinema sp. GBBB05]